MKTFKEHLIDALIKKTSEDQDYEWFTFFVDEFTVNILFSKSKVDDEQNFLLEGKVKNFDLGGKYSAQLHKAHTSVGQDHIHVYEKNNQLFSLNIDGTAHDQSHQTRIPNKVADAIRNKFPNFKLPANNLIENAPDAINNFCNNSQLLLG